MSREHNKYSVNLVIMRKNLLVTAAQWSMGEEQLRPAEFSHPDPIRPQVARADPNANRCKTLPDVQDSPQHHHDTCNDIY